MGEVVNVVVAFAVIVFIVRWAIAGGNCTLTPLFKLLTKGRQVEGVRKGIVLAHY